MRHTKVIIKFVAEVISWIFSIKTLTWLVLSLVTISSVFSFYGATIDNNAVAMALMLLLLTLFSDLKKFNFWGLYGKKAKEEEIGKLKEGQAVQAKDRSVKTDENELDNAERKQISLMDPTKGNFLSLAFEVERLLRIFANINLGKDVGNFVNQEVIDELKKNELLTDQGVKQIDGIRWLRNEFVHAQDHNITPQTLNDGITVAYSLYQELYNWLYPQSNK